jgi:hypothetical protein
MVRIILVDGPALGQADDKVSNDALFYWTSVGSDRTQRYIDTGEDDTATGRRRFEHLPYRAGEDVEHEGESTPVEPSGLA